MHIFWPQEVLKKKSGYFQLVKASDKFLKRNLKPLNLCTTSLLSMTRTRESADVTSTFEELPGANC